MLLGVGAALLLDEFALIWNLRDVYWSRAGHVSVFVTAAFGVALTLAAGRELLRERRRGRNIGLPRSAPTVLSVTAMAEQGIPSEG